MLAIDAGIGMADGSLATLARKLATECAVYESMPPNYCVDSWLDDIRECGFDVRGVLGYCSGASLACALVDRIVRADSARPVLVLLDPVPVDTSELWFIYERFLSTFRGAIDADAYGRAQSVAAEAARRHGDDFAAFAAELRTEFEQVARRACAALGLSDESADDFVERFDIQVAFMLTAAGLPLAADSVSPVVLLSRDATGSPAGMPGGRRFDVPRAELFTTQAVVDSVAAAVGS